MTHNEKEQPDWLTKLNEQQKRAVEHNRGPLLIIAGAGTGKTNVLISRLAYLQRYCQVNPARVLIITFAEKATQELVERSDILLPMGQTADWIMTFHGLGKAILTRNSLDVGLPNGFKILEETAIWLLLKKHLASLPLKYYKPLGQHHGYLRDLCKHFSRLKDENITEEKYDYHAKKIMAAAEKSGDEAELQEAARVRELADLYCAYNHLLIDRGYVDFGDLITYPLRLFTERPNILRQWQSNFDYIMVDEFQDTNTAQYQLVKLLANGHRNLAVVGDDDQSIYRFRGASLSNIDLFNQDFPEAATVVMTNNYRSGQVILDAAYRSIVHNNPDRLEVKANISKRLVAAGENRAEANIQAWEFATEIDETATVVSEIIRLKSADPTLAWKQIAILFRANSAADRFVKECSRLSVPYQYLSESGLYRRPICLQLLNYIKLLDNYHESNALFKVLAMPQWTMNHQDIIELGRYAKRHQCSLFDSLRLAAEGQLTVISGEGLASAAKLLAMLNKHMQVIKDKSASQMIAMIVRDVFYPQLDRDQDWPEFRLLNKLYAKATALEEAIAGAKLKDFSEMIDGELEAGDSGRMPAVNDDDDTVKLATIHSAKGKEYRYVFLVSLSDTSFPGKNQPSDKIDLPEGLGLPDRPDRQMYLQEERRLFYVALTRAQNGLYLSYYKEGDGKADKKISRFFEEMGGVELLSLGDERANLPLDVAIGRLDAPINPPPPLPLPTKFSYSALEAYERCPLQFKYKYILGLPADETGQTAFGNVMHTVVEKFLAPLVGLDHWPEELLTEDRLLEIFHSAWIPTGYNSKEEAEELRISGITYCRQFLAQLLGGDRAKIIGLEQSFEFKLDKWTIYGKIDRIDQLADGSLRLVDYKTGAPVKSIIKDKARQLILYRLGAEAKYRLPIKETALYQFKAADPWLNCLIKPADVIEAQQHWLKLINGIMSGNFEHKSGFQCGYCDFKLICEYRDY